MPRRVTAPSAGAPRNRPPTGVEERPAHDRPAAPTDEPDDEFVPLGWSTADRQHNAVAADHGAVAAPPAEVDTNRVAVPARTDGLPAGTPSAGTPTARTPTAGDQAVATVASTGGRWASTTWGANGVGDDERWSADVATATAARAHDHSTEGSGSEDADPGHAEHVGGGGGRTGPATWVRRPLAWVVAVVMTAVVTALVWGGLTLAHDNALNSARTSALQAAEFDAKALATYDYKHIHHDFGVVEQRSTASFRRSFATSSQGLVKVLVQYHASAKATVLAAGVSSVTPQRAVVILFVNQQVTNTSQAKGTTTDESRVEITLVRGGSGWLIDKVQVR